MNKPSRKSARPDRHHPAGRRGGGRHGRVGGGHPGHGHVAGDRGPGDRADPGESLGLWMARAFRNADPKRPHKSDGE